jgi:hypothetical protein
MENNDLIISEIVNAAINQAEGCSSYEPKSWFDEQEEDEQFIRFVEDLACYYSDSEAVVYKRNDNFG